MLKKKIKEEWSIPIAIIPFIIKNNQRKFLCDNMIIYKDGNIEPYDEPHQLMDALHRQSIEEAPEHVFHMVMDGLFLPFILKRRIRFYKDNGSLVKIENFVEPSRLLDSNFIVVLDGKDNEVFQFDSLKMLAAYIKNCKEFNLISYVFIDHSKYDFERLKVMTLEFNTSSKPHEVEFEEFPMVPF